MVGSWNVKVNVNGMPQKVASAFSSLADKLIGVEYDFLAYLGSQLVNGTNHAVLAKQVLVNGRDSENVVVLIFNEKPNDREASLVSIERVVESGLPMGGVKVDASVEIPADAQTEWDDAFMTFVGSKVEPIAFLGTQVVKGVNFIFAATVTPVAPDAEAKIVVVTVNSLTKKVIFTDLLENKQHGALGYAFSW